MDEREVKKRMDISFAVRLIVIGIIMGTVFVLGGPSPMCYIGWAAYALALLGVYLLIKTPKNRAVWKER